MQPEIITAIIAFLSSLGTWFLARRKNNAEARAEELENVEKNIVIYKKMLDDAKLQIDQLTALYKQTLNELVQERKEHLETKKELHELKETNEHLVAELKKYKHLKKY